MTQDNLVRLNARLAEGRTYVSKTSDIIIKVAAFVGAITIIGGAYSYYLNNIWKPDVQIDTLDFDKGIAIVRVGKKSITVFGDSTFLIKSAGNWGIRFGTSKYNNKYDRLELIKNGMVVEYLKR